MIFFFGTVLAGAVDRVGNQSIKSRFLVVLLPLIPLRSYFVISEPKNFQMTASTVRAIPIRLSAKSILIGYLRLYSWLPSILFLASGLTRQFGIGFVAAGYIALALFAGCFSITMFGLGRLSRAERERRIKLRESTGFAIDPEIFPVPPERMAMGFPALVDDAKA